MRINSRFAAVTIALGGALLLAGCTQGPEAVAPEAPEPTTAPAPDTPTAENAPEGTPQGADLAQTAFPVSWTDALEVASKQFTGDPVSLSLEWKRTAYAYEVELVSDTESYEAVVNADTGEIMFEETEPESAADIAKKRLGQFAPTQLVTPADAMAAAVGAQAGTVSQWEIDDENGVLTYEIEVDTPSGDVDVRIDAQSAAVLEVDR